MNQRGVVIGLLLGVLLNTSDLIAGQGVDEARLARVSVLVREAIDAEQLPGAVVLVGRGDEVVYFEVFGDRALVPVREQLTRDTIFDLASLTKVVATTTSVMQLVEAGQIRLTDRVGTFIPEFSRYGKESVTVRHLLTHMSGLRPDLDLADEFEGYDEAIHRA
ncbi:MAG: serine hydrolase domain-containing protein, partial [Acidobacteriota bacterium]|nr:serine hydrolase domain-containing protein [Acidobacteriota bacterium]